MAEHPLHLITIWARHENGNYLPDDCPQFVTAFPASVRAAIPELSDDWLLAACDQFRHAVDSPVIAFYEGSAAIRRPDGFAGFHLAVIEDDDVNPGWESLELPEPGGEE